MVAFGPDELRERQVRNWLLLLLRFAITRGSEDRLAALTASNELAAAAATGRGAPRFFSRTTKEVCEAILAPGDPHSHDALRRHADRIEDPRLRRAFEAAADLL